jgi:uncharacterized membrane-anchored protein YhcB (DUF1043 family)
MPSIFSMLVMASVELLKRFYPFVALVIGLLITGLIMWLLSFMFREQPPSAEAVRKNREFVERQAQKEVDTLEHFFGFEDEK